MPYLFVLLLIVFIMSLFLGRYELSFNDMVEILLYHLGFEDELNQSLEYIFLQTRLPRLIVAVFAGANLAMAGACFQAIFKNPLASPDILGVSSGCAFGCVLALALGLNIFFLTSFSFVFGILALLLSLFIAKGASNYIMIILAGIIVSAFFQSLIALAQYFVDPQDVLPSITYFLLGSLQISNIKQMFFCLALMSVACGIILYYRWKINLLMLDDMESKSLGLNVVFLRLILIFACTLIVACVVSLCGIIAWVGIIIPHIARLIFKSNNEIILPACIFIGAIFLLIIDNIARSLLAEELPISALSAVFGSFIFCMILYKLKGLRL